MKITKRKLRDRLTTPLSKLFAVTCGVVVASPALCAGDVPIYQPFKSVEDIPPAQPGRGGLYRRLLQRAYPGIKIKLESEDYNADYEEGQITGRAPTPAPA